MDIPSPASGRVASLHLHPGESGTPLHQVQGIEAVAGKGIIGDDRYYGRLSRKTGQPTRRQVSLIAREQIAEHAVALGLQSIPPGAVRANIETLGMDLMRFLGQDVTIGTAVLHFYEARTPCQLMDDICVGLRSFMDNGRQGVMAEVIQSGRIAVGDAIRPAVAAHHLSH
jgi:MOSC domain-containing protein YiiM